MGNLELLKKNISPRRFNHCERVAQLGESLALHYHASIMQVRTASLFHDCARELTPQELITKAQQYHIPVTAYEMQFPITLHAIVGSHLARDIYGITDQVILNAIQFHSFGNPGMGVVEQILFIADFASDDRTYPEAEEVRRVMYDSLERACCDKCKYSIEWHTQKNMQNHPNILKYFQYCMAKKQPC